MIFRATAATISFYTTVEKLMPFEHIIKRFDKLVFQHYDDEDAKSDILPVTERTN